MTREDAISIMNVIVHMLEEKYDTDRVEEAVDMAIKALEQQPKTDVLDKIRAEIKEESKFCPLTEGLERALEIIDKYTAGSEG